jgi:hypothetical protein
MIEIELSQLNKSNIGSPATRASVFDIREDKKSRTQ